MALASHREAFILLRRAVDNMPASLADSERARILLLFADANGNINSMRVLRTCRSAPASLHGAPGTRMWRSKHRSASSNTPVVKA